MKIMKSKCVALFMFSLVSVTLQDGVNNSRERVENCKTGMQKFFGIYDLLLSAKYAVRRYTPDDFQTNDPDLFDIFEHPRNYYNDFEDMNLVFSENIEPPDVFCDQLVANQQEIESCKISLEGIFGTDKPIILHHALYSYRQAWDEENENTLPPFVFPVGSIGFLYLGRISFQIQVDEDNLTHQTQELYCNNLPSPSY